MSQTSVIRLIHTLSKEEKRHFKISTKKQSGNKDYLDLFDMIDQSQPLDNQLLAEKFNKSHPGSSLDNTARYLFKILTDCLIQSKIKEGGSFQLLHGLLRVNLLQERTLPDEGYKELKRLQQIALRSQNHIMQYVIYRYELNYLSSLNFQGKSEESLIEIQMKARDVLKNLRNTHEHHSLYELLKYRLVHSGKVLSEEGKKRLNDLLLSEMGLITSRAKNNFESRKLHLLFQSFFFTDIGDYKSALKIFYELNKLFEQNMVILNHPPRDYFSSLDGILDSLRTVGFYNEMSFYLNKMERLDAQNYPEYFRMMVKKTVIIYQLTIFMGKKNLKNTIQYIHEIDPGLLKGYSMVYDEKQCELLFCIGSAYFAVKDYKKAQKFINEIVLTGKINYQSIIYKASRLLNILIHYEVNDLEFLDYEIRSFKRAFQNKGKLLKTEKMIFKTIKLYPNINKPYRNDLLWKKMEPPIIAIEQDKYEVQLRKYFDFIGWIRSKFGK